MASAGLPGLEQAVFETLEERPATTCATALLNAVCDCPPDCCPVERLLGRWDAPTAAGKLVEGEGALQGWAAWGACMAAGLARTSCKPASRSVCSAG